MSWDEPHLKAIIAGDARPHTLMAPAMPAYYNDQGQPLWHGE